MSDRKILLPSGGTAALTAFFAHRALTLVGDLQYVAPRCGQDFADALCAGLYGNESFRMCRYLPRYFEAEDNQAIRKRFAGDIADLLGGQGSGAAMYIRPFALTSACDLDFLCCAGTAEAFGDTVNAQGILKQRDKFLAESQNA